MAFKIEWTFNAREDLKAIVSYLQEEWSDAISENFIVACYSKIDLIARLPYIGSASEKMKDICRILVTKHNALYYRVEKDKIILLDFFDTRQHPKKNIY